jgi:tetratricopeptide (TPR) repeat protein
MPEDHRVGGPLEAKIRKLQAFYWSDADPDGKGFVHLADAYRKHGDPMEALRILRDGLRRHPELASGHVVRGWVYVEQGDSADAEAAFRAALAVDAHNVSALRGLGDILAARGAAAEAAEVFRVLLPLDPLDADLPGRVEALARAAEAAARAAEGLALAPEEPGPPRPWADPEGVAEELDWGGAALQADQSHLSEAGEPVAGGEPFRDAGASLDDIQPVSPAGVDALVTRTMGDIFLRQGLLDEAEEVYERLLGRDPDDPLLRGKLEEVRARREGKVVSPPLPAEGAADLPGEAASDRIVPIEELASGEIRAIGALAPDLILPIEDLSPDVIVPVQALAPDSSPGDPTLDAFEAWLDELP